MENMPYRLELELQTFQAPIGEVTQPRGTPPVLTGRTAFRCWAEPT